MEIIIARRYSKEVLSTRAGNTPNKPIKDNHITSPCIYPYTDMIVFPNDNVGICCNDCHEITKMGNVLSENIFDIWRGKEFADFRAKMRSGRTNCVFCKECCMC
jgi:hypothetical protein